VLSLLLSLLLPLPLLLLPPLLPSLPSQSKVRCSLLLLCV
jgi:hypothetical protein